MKQTKSAFAYHVGIREERRGKKSTLIKGHLFKCLIPVTMLQCSLFLLAVFLALLADATANAQTSEVFEITDPEIAYQRQCDAIREAFEHIAGRSSNWDAAEKAIKALAEDPTNVHLKKQMVATRALVIEEMLFKLRHATKAAKGIDQTYKNHVNQLDAEIADSTANILENQASVSKESRFLADCLDELLKIEQQLPNTALVSTGQNPTEVIELTEAEQLLIAQMEAQISAAEQQLDISGHAKTLNQQNITALAEMKIEAAREFLAIRKAVCRAKLDQVSLAGVARNDLSYLNLIETKERLAAMRARKSINYPNVSGSSMFKGGYRFDSSKPQNNQSNDDLQSLVNQDRIDRLKKKVVEANQESEQGNKVANATERKNNQ